LIPEPANPDELLAAIRNWFRLLASGQWHAATAMIDEPNCYGVHWSPEKIRRALDLAYAPGCRFRVAHPEGLQFSDPDTAVGEPHAEIVPFDDGRGYSADYDVPLNGGWSELTAQFEFLRRPTGLAMVLHDLHVL
jgi:hypothetical protein